MLVINCVPVSFDSEKFSNRRNTQLRWKLEARINNLARPLFRAVRWLWFHQSWKTPKKLNEMEGTKQIEAVKTETRAKLDLTV